MFTRVCQTLKPNRTKNRPSFFWSRIRPANGARIRPISMVPCERKAVLDEFEHGLEFVRSRVNGVLVSYSACIKYNIVYSIPYSIVNTHFGGDTWLVNG